MKERTEVVFYGATDVDDFKGYVVSLRMDLLTKYIRKAAKNKSRQTRDGLIVLEVTRLEIPSRKPTPEQS